MDSDTESTAVKHEHKGSAQPDASSGASMNTAKRILTSTLFIFFTFVAVLLAGESQFRQQLWDYNVTFKAPQALQELASEASLERGNQLFNEHCASCHGQDGIGQDTDSPMGGRKGDLILAPAMDSTGHAMAHHENALFFVTKHGSAWTARSPMVGWEDRLDDRQMVDIVHWIRSSWTPVQQDRQARMVDHPLP